MVGKKMGWLTLESAAADEVGEYVLAAIIANKLSRRITTRCGFEKPCSFRMFSDLRYFWVPLLNICSSPILKFKFSFILKHLHAEEIFQKNFLDLFFKIQNSYRLK
jgi:hypothetical protein